MYLVLLNPTSLSLKGVYEMEKPGTRAASAIANSSEKCPCLGRTAMNFSSISSTEGLILFVRSCKKNMFFTGSYCKTMQQFVN